MLTAHLAKSLCFLTSILPLYFHQMPFLPLWCLCSLFHFSMQAAFRLQCLPHGRNSHPFFYIPLSLFTLAAAPIANVDLPSPVVGLFMLKPTRHKQRKEDGYCYDGYKTYRRAQSGCIHWLVEREEDGVSAEITQTASAGVCVSARAWNYEEREGAREDAG